jgi:hypothetical protein
VAHRAADPSRRPAAEGSAAERATDRRPPRHAQRRGRGGDERDAPAGRQRLVVGLLAAPGIAHDLAARLARELPQLLGRRFPEVDWDVVVRPEPMAAASESDVDLVEIARRRMLDEGWKLAVCLTDYPVHIGNRPVTAYASAPAGVGLVSVPALGPVNLDERVRDAVLRLVEGLLGEHVDDPEDAEDSDRRRRMQRRLEDLSTPTIGRAELHEGNVGFFAAVGLGNLRLLMGMVRANRPWRLITGLSRALVAALGLDVFGVASPGIWILAAGMGWPRLLLVGVGSVLATCVSLIAAHGLWEQHHPERPAARERVVLFNLTTAITVAIGVLTLHVALFVLNLAAAAVLIPADVLERQVSRPAHLATYLALSWLVTSLATIGGALGAALENDRAVREAAYGYHPDARTEAEA